MARRKDPEPETLPPDSAGSAETVGPAEAAPSAAQPFAVEVEPAPIPPAHPVTDPKPAPPPAPPRRGPGMLGPLLGGALAAIGGFALSNYNLLGLAPSDTSAELSALSAELAELKAAQSGAASPLGAEIAALADRIARLESAPGPDLSRLDGFDQRLAAIEAIPAEGGASTAALAAKLAELEEKLANTPATGADPALQQQLDAALARLGEAEAAATARASEAEAAAAAARRTSELDALTDTVASGQPFAAELQALADPALSEALGSMAETGVPTLGALQATFPDAARQALEIARDSSTETGWSDRIVDFLAAQTGARSLTPREGTDPDAVLSRAEFALSEGRVADALAELQALDPAIRAPLEGWSIQAANHLAAGAALALARGE